MADVTWVRHQLIVDQGSTNPWPRPELQLSLGETTGFKLDEVYQINEYCYLYQGLPAFRLCSLFFN